MSCFKRPRIIDLAISARLFEYNEFLFILQFCYRRLGSINMMAIVCGFEYLVFHKPTPSPSKEGNLILIRIKFITLNHRRVNRRSKVLQLNPAYLVLPVLLVPGFVLSWEQNEQARHCPYYGHPHFYL